MSLIREALEKARREPPAPAANPSYRQAPTAFTRRSSRAPWIVGGAILGVVILALLMGTVRWMTADPWRSPTARSVERERALGTEAGPPRGTVRRDTSNPSSPQTGDVAPAAESNPPRAVRDSDSPARPPESRPAVRAAVPGTPSDAVQRPVAPAGPAAASPTPRESSPQPTPELRLEGLVGSATDPVAVINGALVGVGESVAGYRVVRILTDRVELERDGRALVLKLR